MTHSVLMKAIEAPVMPDWPIKADSHWPTTLCSGRTVAQVPAEIGISHTTAHKWIRRFTAEGE